VEANGDVIDPHFLDLGTSLRWVVSFMPRSLYPRKKNPRYPFDRRLDGPQKGSGRRGEEKIFYPIGTRNSEPSVVQPVASRYTDYAIPAPRQHPTMPYIIYRMDRGRAKCKILKGAHASDYDRTACSPCERDDAADGSEGAVLQQVHCSRPQAGVRFATLQVQLNAKGRRRKDN
jgi:hypothetical protein